MLYCRVTVLDKYLNSQMIACIRWANVPKLSLDGHADNRRVRHRSMLGPVKRNKIPRNRGTTPDVETNAPLLFLYGYPRRGISNNNVFATYCHFVVVL